jgi:hypothetical protein
MSNADYFTSSDISETEPVVYENYCKLPLYKEIYCTYTGYCERNRVVNRQLLCFFCEYRKTLDIPQMIKKELEK